jgi:hypothetical protein
MKRLNLCSGNGSVGDRLLAKLLIALMFLWHSLKLTLLWSIPTPTQLCRQLARPLNTLECTFILVMA